jgi:adenine-specific DNA-methyltransferase
MSSNSFDFPKDEGVLKELIAFTTSADDVVVDFFAGSATTAHAVMQQNADDGGNRKFILVQIPQPIDAKKQKEAHHFVTQTLGKAEATIFEITAERIRRAGAKIEAEVAAQQSPQATLYNAPAASTGASALDTGFRVFELVDDPDALILQMPLGEATQADVHAFQTRIATPQPAQLERILYNLLLAEGLPLTTPIQTLHAEQLYRAADVLLVLHTVPLEALTDLLRALRAQTPPVQYLTVYAPWVQDDNFTLGLKTLVESLGMGEDKLRLRG